MNIRVFKAEDTEAVICLWQDCGLLTPQNDPHKDILRKLRVNPELFLIGEVDGIIIASVMGGYEGHRGWINYLAVHPAYRKKSYGREIVAAVEERLIAKGAPKINLQVRTAHQTVIRFYTSLGYSVDDVTSMGKRLIKD